MLTLNRNRQTIERAQCLLARIRRKQLDLALNGRVTESARYARRARRVRNMEHDEPGRGTGHF